MPSVSQSEGARVVSRRRDGKATRGAALVEAAFALLALFTILYGVVELGFMFRSASVASSASRAGARVGAAVYPDATDRAAAVEQVRLSVEEALRERSTTDTPVFLRVYHARADGLPSNGASFEACNANCFRYSWDGTQFVLDGGSWTSPVVCGTNLDRLGVYIRLDHEPFTDLMPISGNISERTVMRLEPSDNCS